MRYILAEGISFCAPTGRPVFLDLRNDRYLCLASDAEQSFRRLCAGEMLCAADRTKLDELVSSGVLDRSVDGPGPTACDHPIAGASALEDDCGPRAANVLHALLRLAGANLEMRLRSLRSTLEHLRIRKLVSDFEVDTSGRLKDIAAALHHSSLIASPLDRCLPRSIAAAHMMIDHSFRPELVIGVCLQPFSAHCWVQHGPVLVNDTTDRVRNYSPILVV